MIDVMTVPQAAEVKVQNVTKRFGKQVVLDNISFEVAAGETFVIMGPSGSGKSVLLKNIMGLERPEEGRVLINELDASKPETRKEIITSIVFQGGALFNSMTVYDNLAFYSREHGLYSKSQLKEEVESTLAMLSLSDAASKYPSELSGGMKKRVAIARSLMVKPQLLLYDEPTSELDPIMGATISEIIATLNEKFRVTSIVVSHDPYLACSIANKVALLFHGKLHKVAKPSELYESEDPKIVEFLKPKIDIMNPRFKKFNI
ncbi:MAG: ABC transporter ATP-binding protein [Verrucomicrobia bacterium]|nr:MAG: ABC transporter ATP-binding protein [Verrucomicrobiota bacterium]